MTDCEGAVVAKASLKTVAQGKKDMPSAKKAGECSLPETRRQTRFCRSVSERLSLFACFSALRALFFPDK